MALYLVVSTLLLFILVPVSAQEKSRESSYQDILVENEGVRIVYDEKYFSGFNAVTAEDLLKRIPGIQDILKEAQAQAQSGTSARRGFGSTGDQILIDGRRLSGKNNNIAAALRRIQATQVLKIEVIRGAAPDLDVRTAGVVLNVVLKESLVSDITSWETSLTHYSDGNVKPGGQLSYSGDTGALSYSLAVAAIPAHDFLDRYDLFIKPGGDPFLRQEEEQLKDRTDLELTANLNYVFLNGDVANLNTRFSRRDLTETEPSRQFDLFGGEQTFTGTFFQLRNLDVKTWEVGGDYEHIIKDGSAIKLRFLINSKIENSRRAFSEIPLSGAEDIYRVQFQFPKRSEKIVRTSYTFNVSRTGSIELGGEAAINELDQLVQLFTTETGAMVEVPLFNPDSKIDENRFETFTTYTWRPITSLQVDAAIDTEYSRLRQVGTDVNQTRSLFYVRPRIDVRYDYSKLIQFRGRAERTVSQLNFTDFVSGFNTDDNVTDVVEAGNPSLVPQKAWEYDFTLERRLMNDEGVWALRLYYFNIENLIDRVPVGDGTVAATGNIGPAKELGLQLTSGLRLRRFGLSGASIDASYLLRHTSATDGFTGQKRRMHFLADRLWSANFRHDTSWHNLSYGISTSGFGRGGNIGSALYGFDVDYTDIIRRRVDISGFIEVKPFDGITMRLDAKRILKRGATRDRIFFVGNRANRILKQTEFREGTFQREVKLSLRGAF